MKQQWPQAHAQLALEKMAGRGLLIVLGEFVPTSDLAFLELGFLSNDGDVEGEWGFQARAQSVLPCLFELC